MPEFSEVIKIRHNSKENLSAISASKNFQIDEHLVEMEQYAGYRTRLATAHRY
jgi:hypothetical protein